MREFGTAVERRSEEEPVPVEFKVTGELFAAVKPTDEIVAFAVAATAPGTTDAEKVKGTLDFLEQCLVPEHRTRFKERLLDRKDPLDLALCGDIMDYLVEQWGGRPPTSHDGSSAGRRRTGRSSTGSARSAR